MSWNLSRNVAGSQDRGDRNLLTQLCISLAVPADLPPLPLADVENTHLPHSFRGCRTSPENDWSLSCPNSKCLQRGPNCIHHFLPSSYTPGPRHIPFLG